MALPWRTTVSRHAACVAIACLRAALRQVFGKSRAVVRGSFARCMSQGLPAVVAATCHRFGAYRSMLAQGFPAVARSTERLRGICPTCVLVCLWMVMQPAAADAAACPAVPAIRFVPLGAGLWWVPAADGESNESSRGIVSNLLIARDGKRLWLVGSGPSPAFGQALACRARQHIGRVVTDIVNPWARARRRGAAAAARIARQARSADRPSSATA
jgi:hypothetical protein